MAAPVPQLPKPRVRFYREFLTPALHRRFTRAASLTLLLCYLEAVIIAGKPTFFWSWFPIGPAGIRALLLFISSLLIFVLRVAQLHFGERTTVSQFETFKQYFFHFNTLQTLGFHLFSAWWFSEVYIWSVPAGAHLGWVVEGKSYERQRLNERPIYFRSLLFMLAVSQSWLHISNDYDQVALQAGRIRVQDNALRPLDIEPPMVQMRHTVPHLLQDALMRATIGGVFGPFMYHLLIRPIAWPWTLSVARIFWSIPKDSAPSRIPPYHISLILRSATSGLMLICLWQISNAVFQAFVAQPPLKNGQPLTADSRDANGSLLNGLKSRKQAPKTFALWELLLITSSHKYEARRKTIFTEIDRNGGSTWSQVLNVCLDTILGINDRIAQFANPPKPAGAVLQQPQVPLQSLPRLASPLRQDLVLNNPPTSTNTRDKLEVRIGAIAKSFGDSPSSPLSPRAKEVLGTVLETARDKILTKEQLDAIDPATIKSSVHEYIMQFLRSPIGTPFRQVFNRRLGAVILGSPYSELASILNAIDSISALAYASLTEDQFGTANRDIPIIIRTFTSVINNIDRMVNTMPVNWTDIDFDEAEGLGRRVEDVEFIKRHLKTNLRRLVDAFGDYAASMALEAAELTAARRAAGPEVE